MNPALVTVLSAAGLAGAVGALIVYFGRIALRPGAVRLINGAGLFFTGVGLAEAGLTLRVLPASASLGGGVCVVALLLAVWFQAVATLRGRSGDRQARAAATGAEGEASPSPVGP